MEQLQIFTVPSPCRGICQAGPRGYCIGCFRSRDERFGWQQLTDAQKAKVIKLCGQRERRAILQKRQTHADEIASSGQQIGFDDF